MEANAHSGQLLVRLERHFEYSKTSKTLNIKKIAWRDILNIKKLWPAFLSCFNCPRPSNHYIINLSSPPAANPQPFSLSPAEESPPEAAAASP